MKRKTYTILAMVMAMMISSTGVCAEEMNITAQQKEAVTETAAETDTTEADAAVQADAAVTNEADAEAAITNASDTEAAVTNAADIEAADIEAAVTDAAQTGQSDALAEAVPIQQTDAAYEEAVTEDEDELYLDTLAVSIVASGTENSLKWSLDSTGALTISGSGDYSVYKYSNDGAYDYYPAWYKYRSKIKTAVVSASGLTTTANMFYGCTKLTSVKFTGLKKSTLKYIDSMFSGCTSLTQVQFTAFNTANVVGMGYVFYGCSSLKNLDLSSFDTGNVEWTLSMFEGCSSLTSLDLSSWETESLGDVNSMFDGCKSLTTLDLSSMDLSDVYNSGFMFADCTSLKSIAFPKNAFSSIQSMNYMFENCTNLSGEFFLYTMPYDYEDAFKGAATASGSKILVCFTGDCKEADALKVVKTKSSGSHIYLCPQTPTLLSVAMTESGVLIKWKGYRPTGYFYRVFRKTDGETWKKVGDTKSVSYTDTTAVSGQTYYYTVRMYDSSSNPVSSYNTTGLSIDYIAAPANITVSNTAGGAKVTWTKSTGAKLYRVYRKNADGGWTKFADTTGNYAVDSAAVSGNVYTYTVRCLSSDAKTFTSAYNTTGTSALYLSQPSLTLSNEKTGTLVKWDESEGASGYYIYRRTAGSNIRTRIGSVSGAGNLTYTDQTAVKGTTYYYTVRAYNGKTLSPYKYSNKITW